MPTTARRKHPEAVYHVMARSITEFDFFPNNEDKSHFLDLLKVCNEKFKCKIYSFCLMTNHYHILLDTNGYDISKYMKSLNLRYVKYINKKYGRRGHLLAERFNSKIVDRMEYALTVSAYIHNNVKDLASYYNRIFEYPYSSMGIYLGKHKDIRNLVDTSFILGCIDENNLKRAIKSYAEMVVEKRETGINTKLKKYLQEFEQEQVEYKSYRTVLLRDKEPQAIIKVIARRLGIKDTKEIMHRWKRTSMRFREVSAYTLTVLCGMGIKEACEYMCNITGSCLSKLSEKGFQQLQKDIELQKLIFS